MPKPIIEVGMEKIGLGLLGASKIAAKVMPYIQRVADIYVVGVAARSAESAQNFANTHGLEKAFSTYPSCVQNDDIDAVYISVLNSNHAELIELALSSGKHVLCEKPLVLSSADAIRLYEIARRSNLVLLEGLMYRFHPQVQMVREVIRSGRFGEIKSVNVDFSFLLHDLDNRTARATRAGGGGALNDLGCYAVDFILSVLNERDSANVECVSVLRREDAEIDLATSATLRFKSGVEAHINCAIDHPSLNLWEVRGSHGSVSAPRHDPQGEENVPIYLVNEDSLLQTESCPQGAQFEEEFRAFAQAISGEREPFILPEESIACANLMEKIRSFGKVQS